VNAVDEQRHVRSVMPLHPADDAAEVRQVMMQVSRPAVGSEEAAEVVESCARTATRRAATARRDLFMNMAGSLVVKKGCEDGRWGQRASFSFSSLPGLAAAAIGVVAGAFIIA